MGENTTQLHSYRCRRKETALPACSRSLGCSHGLGEDLLPIGLFPCLFPWLLWSLSLRGQAWACKNAGEEPDSELVNKHSPPCGSQNLSSSPKVQLVRHEPLVLAGIQHELFVAGTVSHWMSVQCQAPWGPDFGWGPWVLQEYCYYHAKGIHPTSAAPTIPF